MSEDFVQYPFGLGVGVSDDWLSGCDSPFDLSRVLANGFAVFDKLGVGGCDLVG
jgi:hypothetical protein